MKVTLYRRNVQGHPCFWSIQKDLLINQLLLEHGVVNKTPIIEVVNCKDLSDLNTSYNRRINDKRKAGYKYLNEVKDNNELPVEGMIYSFLDKYLPKDRTTADGSMLPMLAKVYDNSNNKLFNKCPMFTGQYKINGLRCFISAKRNEYDLFKPIELIFQSREGTYWKSLTNLEEYLLSVIPINFLNDMIDEDIILDGELYLPGHSVNEINHFVKDPKCVENKLLQYWCYDIAIEALIQSKRNEIRHTVFNEYFVDFDTKEDHLNNKSRFVCLPDFHVVNGQCATDLRDGFIMIGFEGLILRNPDKEYQYGARNSAMIKYKKSTDGRFKIVDIYPEGIKRQDIPLILVKNDINDATFEVHIGGSFEYQKSILENKEKYIDKTLFIEYGERSGVNQVPFHVKTVTLYDNN